MKAISSHLLTLTALVLSAGSLLGSVTAHAQQVYRIVGPDGKVTFSDKPPPAASNARVTAENTSAAGAPSGTALPFELRQVVSKYPVTLYTGENCTPCGTAKSMLNTRGVPFSEKTVRTAADAQALQRISGDNVLPFVTIGGQQLKGYSDAEWTQFLTAAGYPATSALPAGYRQVTAVPLVTATATAAAPASAAGAGNTAASSAPPPPPVQAPPSNPAGIKF